MWNRRSAILGMIALTTPASARSYWVAPGCHKMTAWHLRIGNIRLNVPVKYKPIISQNAVRSAGFWERALFGKLTYVDNSIVQYCQKPQDQWLAVDDITFNTKGGLDELKIDAGTDLSHDGVTLIALSPRTELLGLRDRIWIEGPVPGFLFSGGDLLSKEKLLRGGQALGTVVSKGNKSFGWATRFHVQTSDGLYVLVDSTGFTLSGMEGLKADLKVVESFLDRVVVSERLGKH